MIVISKKRSNCQRNVLNIVSCLMVLYCFALLTGCAGQAEAKQGDQEVVNVAAEETGSESVTTDKINDLSMTDSTTIDSESVAEDAVVLPSYEVTDMDAVKYATTSLNVRSGPTTDYDIIGYFFVNEEVTVTGQADTGWYQVDYLGEEAYVSDIYLSDEQVEVPVPVTITPENTEVVVTPVTEENTELTEVVADTTQDKNYILNTSIDGAGIVFIGDSRTVAMYLATKDNNNLWVGAVGKGRDWFVNYGSVQADPYITAGTKVVINLGVNDTRQVDKYIEDMNQICQTWIDRGASVYYLSVNPLDYSKYVDNDDIVAFNSTLSAGLMPDIKWIDSYSYLINNGYTTVDGIHYNHATSKAIYNYCLDNL